MIKRGARGRKNIWILSAIILISFALMTINFRSGKATNVLESVFVWMISPIQEILTHSVDTVSGVFSHYFLLVGVSRENEKLHQEIERLKSLNNQLLENRRWQERVGRLIQYEQLAGNRSLIASVIGRDATQWSRVIMIDKGTRQGVVENLSVVTHAGVIGHVIQPFADASKVLLITDTRSAVDGLFQGSRVTGVVVGTGGSTCEMKFVPITAGVKVGDRVLSSGLGGIFPKGLEVGSVLKVKKKRQGLFQEILVAPSADLSRLEEVLVLLS